MSAYIDTSVLGAYYCPEPGSVAAEKALLRIEGPVISALSEVEFVSLVSKILPPPCFIHRTLSQGPPVDRFIHGSVAHAGCAPPGRSHGRGAALGNLGWASCDGGEATQTQGGMGGMIRLTYSLA